MYVLLWIIAEVCGYLIRQIIKGIAQRTYFWDHNINSCPRFHCTRPYRCPATDQVSWTQCLVVRHHGYNL